MQLFEQLRGFFAARDLPAYLVGGSVRDALLGRPYHDVDIAVMGDASDTAQTLAQFLEGTFVPLDPQRGIFRVVVQRADSTGLQQRSEREAPWTLDLSSAARGIQADLARRDFTIDAIAVPLCNAVGEATSWPLVDPFGAQRDLHAGLIQAVSPQIFQEDPLRLLRAVRLAAQLGFTIEADTLALLSRDAPLLSRVAGERVRDEFLTILAQPGVEISLGLLEQQGLLHALIPELSPARGVTQPFEHYWDVYDHSLQCVAMVERVLDPGYRKEEKAGQAIPWQADMDSYFNQEASDSHSRATLLKLAGLLHDVAKPETKTLEPSGRARFLGHPSLGADKTEEIARRIRLSGRGVAMLRTLVEHHLRPSHLAQRGEMPTPRAIYRYFRDLGEVAVDTLYLNLADYLAARGPALELEPWRRHCYGIAQVLEQGAATATPQGSLKLVDGHDLMGLFSLPAGPDLRHLLEEVREAQATGEISTRQEALALLERSLGRPAHGKDGKHMESMGRRHG